MPKNGRPVNFIGLTILEQREDLTLENSEFVTLFGAVGKYTAILKQKEKTPSAARELDRFVKHFRGETTLNSITPSKVGDYAERASKNGTSEDMVEGLQAVRKFLLHASKEDWTAINLATHFRIKKVRLGSRTREKTTSESSGQQMTQFGHDQLVGERNNLVLNRTTISQAIHSAASDGDVRENAPLEAAREQQGREEARIKEIDALLRTAIIVDSFGNDAKIARVGARIRIEEIGAEIGKKNKRSTYTLVSPTEASPTDGKISDASPLGKSLIGKSAGSQVEVNTPKGKASFKIIKVS